MKKISLLIIAITTIASAQLRVGIDVSRQLSLSGLPAETADGMGFTLGYEQTLFSLVGLGAEYSAAGDGDEGIDMLYGYAVAKIPFGIPTFRGIVRAGYSLPMGDAADYYDAGLAYGAGLRFKLPLFPIGLEALYTMHNLEMKSTGDDLGDMLASLLKLKYNVMTLTATYSF